MSTNRDFDRIAGAWLAEGPSELADRVLDAALDEVHLTHQRRHLRVPWRTPTLNTPLRLAAAIAIIAVVGYAGLTFLNPRGGGPGALTSPTPPPTATPEPSPTPAPTADLLDTATWTTYVSDRYGFSIAHPANWEERPSDHVWTMATDGADWLNTGAEVFVDPTPDKGIRVSTFSVAVGPGTAVDAWLQTYCETSGNTPCTNVEARSAAVTMDGHPGFRPAFNQDTQAFFLVDSRVYGVSIWYPPTDPALSRFGNGYRLLDALLSTMRVLPQGPATAAPTSAPS
jgi:hypothetical protein